MCTMTTHNRTKRLGKNLRQARDKRGLSQPELAREAGVSLNTIKYLEEGANGNPQSRTLMRLARVLGVEVQELVAGVGESEEVSDLVEELLASDWIRRQSPDDTEVQWLHSLASLPWDHAPTLDSLYMMLRAYRDSRRKS